MVKIALQCAVALLLLSIPVALEAADARSLLPGLTPLKKELVTAEADLLTAGSAVTGEKPALEADLAAAAKKEADIKTDHDGKHEAGTPDFEKWNAVYVEAVAEKERIAAKIQAIDRAYADAQEVKNAVVLRRQQLVAEILSAFKPHNPCAQKLTQAATDEALALCGRVDFDGADPNLPPLDLSTARPPNSAASNSGVVADEGTPEEQARKRQAVDALVRASTTTQTRTVTVVPPPPGAPAAKPSLSDALIELLRRLGRK